MTSKLSFRARALDATKPMVIYNREDLPELGDIPAINRAVPALPTGMEKEEEAEKHLQDILKSSSDESNRVIPTPEVFQTDMETLYNELYKGEFKIGRQYIHVQPFASDCDLPDYDMDSEDESFLNDVLKNKFEEFDELQFEDMIDKLEKNSGHQIVSSKDAKLLLSRRDDDLIFAVYDYWVDKRLRLKMPLVSSIKSAESGGGASLGPTTNPYVCFRRRTEKMQTRKNRKNDESSYEKMLKLRRDLNRTVTLLEMVRRREKIKKQFLEFGSDIFEKRLSIEDFDGKIYNEIFSGHNKLAKSSSNSWPLVEAWASNLVDDSSSNKKKSGISKKKKKYSTSKIALISSSIFPQTASNGVLINPGSLNKGSSGPEFGTSLSSEEEDASEVDDDELEGPFVFRRKNGCQYYSPVEPISQKLPWEEELKFRYSYASLSNPTPRGIGFVRRRVGRGGRILLDRIHRDITSDTAYPHFRPVTPPHCRDEDWDPYRYSDSAVKKSFTNSGNSKLDRSKGLKTVAVDPMSALNAAGALVSNNVIEMFDGKSHSSS